MLCLWDTRAVATIASKVGSWWRWHVAWWVYVQIKYSRIIHDHSHDPPLRTRSEEDRILATEYLKNKTAQDTTRHKTQLPTARNLNIWARYQWIHHPSPRHIVRDRRSSRILFIRYWVPVGTYSTSWTRTSSKPTSLRHSTKILPRFYKYFLRASTSQSWWCSLL